MTTMAVPTRPVRNVPAPRLPWRRMAWVVWRQHRLTLAGVLALFGATALYLVFTGQQIHHAYAIATACRPAGSGACRQALNNFADDYSSTAQIAAALLQVVPALIGAFAGAPLLAREFETGTFRYAFTQGFGRMRWTLAKLASLAVVVVVVAAAFSVLFSWCYGPIFGDSGYGTSPLEPIFFDLRGVAFPAWTLAAFAVGILAGVLIRRVIPAMFATLAAWAGLAVITGMFLRRHYMSPLVTTNPNIGPPAWVMSEVWTKGGIPVSLSTIQQSLGQAGVRAVTPEVFQPGPSTPANFDPVKYLLQHGFAQVTTYEPASRFWAFQWIEGAWLLALSIALIAATLWLVRRRAT